MNAFLLHWHDVIINWPRATNTMRIMGMNMVVQRRSSMKTVHGFGTKQIRIRLISGETELLFAYDDGIENLSRHKG